MSSFNEADHPRRGDGRWAAKELEEVDPDLGVPVESRAAETTTETVIAAHLDTIANTTGALLRSDDLADNPVEAMRTLRLLQSQMKVAENRIRALRDPVLAGLAAGSDGRPVLPAKNRQSGECPRCGTGDRWELAYQLGGGNRGGEVVDGEWEFDESMESYFEELTDEHLLCRSCTSSFSIDEINKNI